MLRVVLGVIFGYVVIVVATVAANLAAFFGLGVDFAYEPGTYDVTRQWLGVNLGLALLGAVVGGFLAAAVGGRRAANVLAVVIILLGLLYAIPKLMAPAPEPRSRPAGQSVLEAMQNAAEHPQPSWYLLLLPVVGATGAFLGGRLKREPTTVPPAAP